MLKYKNSDNDGQDIQYNMLEDYLFNMWVY